MRLSNEQTNTKLHFSQFWMNAKWNLSLSSTSPRHPTSTQSTLFTHIFGFLAQYSLFSFVVMHCSWLGFSGKFPENFRWKFSVNNPIHGWCWYHDIPLPSQFPILSHSHSLKLNGWKKMKIERGRQKRTVWEIALERDTKIWERAKSNVYLCLLWHREVGKPPKMLFRIQNCEKCNLVMVYSLLKRILVGLNSQA